MNKKCKKERRISRIPNPWKYNRDLGITAESCEYDQNPENLVRILGVK
jgi:hypothetical protein